MARKRHQTWFYIIESGGHLICTERKDVLVPDSVPVNVQDKVKFKYGVQVLSGVIIFSAATEKEVLEAMKVQLKAGKPSKLKDSEGDNVGGLRRRKVVPNVQSQPSTSTDSKVKKKEKNEIKKKRKHAENTVEALLHGTSKDSSDPNYFPDDDNSDKSGTDSSSADSDEPAASAQAKKCGKDRDVKQFSSIYTSSDETEDDSAIRKDSNYENVSKKTENGSNGAAEGESTKVQKETDKPKGKPETDLSIENVEDKTEEKEAEVRNQSKKKKDKKEKRKKRKRSENRESESEKGEKKKKNENGDSDSEQGNKKKRKNKKKERKLKRNLTVYPGVNYNFDKDSPNVVKVHDSYEVYIIPDKLQTALGAKSAHICCRKLMQDVYTLDALQGSSAFGFPPRGKGKQHYSKMQTLPRLHPDGTDAIIAKILAHQETNKMWRPKVLREGLRSTISNVVCLAKALKANDDTSESDSSETSESSED